MHGTDEGGCEGYFCGQHRDDVPDYEQELRSPSMCKACAEKWMETHEWKDEEE
jgi:hypothetical protein